MAANFADMVANRAASATRARIMEFYRSKGFDEPTVAALTAAELAKRNPSDLPVQDPGFEGETAEPLVRAMQEHARANPRELAATRIQDRDMPGFDPTRSDQPAGLSYDPIMQRLQGGGHDIQFSRPMTDEDVAISRQTRPIPRGSVGSVSVGNRSVLNRVLGGPDQAYAEPAQGAPIVDQAKNVIASPRAQPAAAPDAEGEPGYTMPGAAGVWAGSGNAAPLGAFNPIGSGRGADPRMFMQASKTAAPAVRTEPPVPQRRPENLGDQPGFFSRLFKDPYAGKSSRQLYEEAQTAQNQNYEARANLLNIRAAREAAPSAEKRGGAVSGKPHKDAALHKALDIIHAMMLQNRR
jgi:hypothetical protein